MKILKSIFENQAFKICIGVVIIQQTLVATGTYLMGDLSANISTEGFSVVKLGILFLSIILSGSFFHFLMKYYMTVAQKDVLSKFFQSYSVANYSRPDLWRNSSAKSERHDVMIREGQDSISQTVQFAADSVATSLNIIFNTVSVILITSAVMGVSIVIAGVFGLLVIHLADKFISETAKKEMDAQNEVNGFLARSWDNILLGNRSAFKRWKTNFDTLFGSARVASLTNVKINDGVVSLASLITSGIVISTVFVLLYLNQNNTSKVVALLVMLPRSMQIVMHIQVIQSYWAHWKYLFQRLAITEKAIGDATDIYLDGFIDITRIRVCSDKQDYSVSDLENKLKETCGRFTITGGNGVGKSTLLLKLKRLLDEDGLYIPSHHQLELSEPTFSKSSGEVAMCALKDAADDEARVILLDEWDANLSKENQGKLDNIIKDLSKNKLVIEIRHHAPVG